LEFFHAECVGGIKHVTVSAILNAAALERSLKFFLVFVYLSLYRRLCCC
jgi:hypothetical protein